MARFEVNDKLELLVEDPSRLTTDAEMARWHLRNPNCKHVYLGICHDSGYASFLGLFKQDDTWRERVTLLSSGFVRSAIEATGLDRIDLQLPDRLPSSELTTITTLHRSSSHPLLDSPSRSEQWSVIPPLTPLDPK